MTLKSKARQKQIIKNLLIPKTSLRNEKVDVEALVDSKLSLNENWSAIKQKYGIKTCEDVRSNLERYKNVEEVEL